MTHGYFERARRVLGTRSAGNETSGRLARAYDVGTLTMTPDGSIAVSSGADGLTIWDVRKRRPLCSIDNAPLKQELGKDLGTPRSAVMMPNWAGIACTYGESSYVACWSIRRCTLKRIYLYDIEDSYGAVMVTPDGRRVLLNHYGAEMLYAVDLNPERERGNDINVGTHEAIIASAALTPDQQCLAARDVAGMLFFWDGRSGTYDLIHEIDTGHEYSYESVYISPNGRYFAISEPQPRVWNAKTGEPTLELAGGGNVAFTPDDRFLIFQDYVSGDALLKRNIHVCEIETGKRVASLEDTDWGATAMAVTPDGKLLMCGHADGTVRFWDLETYTLLDAVGNNSAS